MKKFINPTSGITTFTKFFPQKKKRISKVLIALFIGLVIAGCSSEEPKEQPMNDSTNQAIQAAADKAHAVIDKTATVSKNIAEKAEEINDTARKAATEMSATIQRSSERIPEKTTESPATSTPAETHK